MSARFFVETCRRILANWSEELERAIFQMPFPGSSFTGLTGTLELASSTLHMGLWPLIFTPASGSLLRHLRLMEA